MAKRKDEILIVDEDEAIKALEEMEEIQAEIAEKEKRCVALKKAVTEFAVGEDVSVLQLDDHYYRKIQRMSRSWDADILKALCKGKKVDGTPLWQVITKRVPDPDRIQDAVSRGRLSEKEVSKAYIEKPQSPFLQRFDGEADDE